MEDKFKINWSETKSGCNTVSVTGYSYQVEAWQSDLLKTYPESKLNTKVVSNIEHSNGLVTIAVSRRIKKE